MPATYKSISKRYRALEKDLQQAKAEHLKVVWQIENRQALIEQIDEQIAEIDAMIEYLSKKK